MRLPSPSLAARTSQRCFQALKRHFDAPPGTVEFTGFAAGEGYCVKGSHKNHPRGGGQRAAGDGIAFLRCSLPRFGPRRVSRLRRFSECNKPKGQRRSFFARDPDGPVENSGVSRSRESGQNIERLAVPVEPVRTTISAPRSKICATGSGCRNPRSAAMRISPLATGIRSSGSPPFSSVSSIKLKRSAGSSKAHKQRYRERQALPYEGAASRCLPELPSGLWNCRPIEKPNAPPACRGRGPASGQRAYEAFHPGDAVAQALQQSNVGKVRKACGRSPRAYRSQPHAAKAISQDQPQKIGRALHRARPQKRRALLGRRLRELRPPPSCLSFACQSSFRSNSPVMPCSKSDSI